MQKLNSVKGTKDLFGKTILEHDYVLKNFEDVCVFNNFKKISTPILEHENIFVKTLGVSSDIISKEMYHFKDQGGDDHRGQQLCTISSTRHGVLETLRCEEE